MALDTVKQLQFGGAQTGGWRGWASSDSSPAHATGEDLDLAQPKPGSPRESFKGRAHFLQSGPEWAPLLFQASRAVILGRQCKTVS